MKAIKILFVLVIFTTLGCKAIKQLAGSIDDASARAERMIDNAIADIQSQSGSWQNVLKELAEELPQEIDASIRNEAQNLATRTVATTGTEIRCNVDFLANRAVQALKNLKAKLLNKPSDVRTLPPILCQVSPDAIDLKDDPSDWPKITYYGYDMDHQDQNRQLLNFVLVNSNGSKTVIPQNRIARTTHYQITLNLGGMARQIYQNQTVKIASTWGDEMITTQGEVAVIPWEPKRKTVQQHVIGAREYMPPHVRGDRDFYTHDDEHMSVDVRGELIISSFDIKSRLYMHAREERHDWTEVEGWSPEEGVYTAPRGWKIIEVTPRNASREQQNVNRSSNVAHNWPSTGVVSRFEVWADHGGDEAGTWTKVRATFRPVKIILEETSPGWLN